MIHLSLNEVVNLPKALNLASRMRQKKHHETNSKSEPHAASHKLEDRRSNSRRPLIFHSPSLRQHISVHLSKISPPGRFYSWSEIAYKYQAACGSHCSPQRQSSSLPITENGRLKSMSCGFL